MTNRFVPKDPHADKVWIDPKRVLDVERIYDIVSRRCANLGIRVIFKPVKAPQTNGNTMEFPIIGSNPTDEQLLTLMGWVSHECGHHMRPAAFEILQTIYKKGSPQSLMSLFNILEDDVMERVVGSMYPGDRKALVHINDEVMERITSKLESGMFNAQDDWAPLATLVEFEESRTDWDFNAQQFPARMYNAMPADAKAIVDKIRDFDLVPKLRARPDEMGTYQITYDLHKILYPTVEIPTPEEVGESIANGEGDKTKGDAGTADVEEDPRRPNGNDESMATKGQDDIMKGKDKQETEGQGYTVDFTWKDAELSEHDPNAPRERGGSMGPQYKISGDFALAPLAATKRRVYDMSQKEVRVFAPNVAIYTETRGCSKEGNDIVVVPCYAKGGKRFMPPKVSNSLANRIRIHLMSEKRSHAQYDQEAGKLDKRNIIRLALPPVNGGEWNKKVFYTPREKRDFNTCITLLVDWSGSMDGSKRDTAGKAAIIMSNLFNERLRIPTMIATFSNRTGYVDIGLVKKYDARTSDKELATRFNMCDFTISGNNDADSLWWAYHEALGRKEKRKLIIVLSDGAPTSSYKGSATKGLYTVCGIIEKDKRVELHGIGIHTDSVDRYYKSSLALHDVSELETTLLQLLGGKIHASQK